jgi:transposase
LNTTEPDLVAFAADVETICTLYAYTPLLAALGTRIASCDELTSMQALERKAPTKAMRPGLVERREFEYIRHGTQSAIVSFDVASGKVAHASVGPTRTEVDFVVHIRQTVATDPEANWLFIVDQLNTHQSLGLVELVAELCGLTDEVEQMKQERGLKSMVNRKMFLNDPAHRIQFIYTPTHTSWLNQVEIWFSILVRRVLKRGDFSSVEDLRAKVLAFIAYFNQTAKPFRWTFTGRPLVV